MTTQKQVIDTKKLIELHKKKNIRDMFCDIEKIINRVLIPKEKMFILEWMQSFNIKENTVVKCFNIAKEDGTMNINYVYGVIKRKYKEV